jgi:hypothetical protein
VTPFTYVNEASNRIAYFCGLDGPWRFGVCVAALPKRITDGQWPPARRDQHLATAVFSHFTPDTVALLTSVQKVALEEWAILEPAAAPMLKAAVEVAVARKLLDVASTGERDPERLKKAALSEVTFSTAVENACGNDRAGPVPTRSVRRGRPE